MPGSHGSLTKAGKVRSQTPPVESHRPPKRIPRIRNRVHYKKRVLRNQDVGQPRRGRR